MLFKLAAKFDAGTTPSESKMLTTCVRALQCMLPTVLSIPEISVSVLWANKRPEALTEEQALALCTAEEEHKAQSSEQSAPPLGVMLIQSLVNLLFRQEYTIAKLTEEESATLDARGIDAKVIWSGGLQYETTRQHKERKYDRVRIDILRLLLVCLSSHLYHPPKSGVNYFAAYVTCGKIIHVKNLFFSLLNTVVSYNWRGYVL
jgi:hypothetical protein